jgi:hypothetical protein
MAAPTVFTIDKVSWHTSVRSNPETPVEVLSRFKVVVNFLQVHGLVTRRLLDDGKELEDDFEIRSSDLTPEGMAVMKKGYDKWLKRIVNKRKDLTDTSILEKALRDIGIG